MLDVVRLRVLAAVAEHGSVTAAARALHYSQPAVSHHLARLEAETGARLLERAGRGVRLTPEGDLLARRAREIIGRVDAADAELAALVEVRAGRVRVAAFHSALSALVPPTAVALRRRYPDTDLRLVEAHPIVARRMLRAGDVDAAIVFRYDDVVPDDGLRYSHLLDDPMHLLSLDGATSLAEHRDSTWIAGCEYCRPEFVAACEAAGFTPHIAFTSDDTIVDQALVCAGLGVSTMPGLALRSYRAPAIRASRLWDFRRRIYVATYGDPPDPPITTAFVAELRRVAAELDRSGPSVLPREPGA